MRNSDRVIAVAIVGGLALGTLGQFVFVYRREYVWDGVLLWGAGILFLSLAQLRARRAERGMAGVAGRRWPRWLWFLRRHPVRALMAMCGLWSSFVAGLLAGQRAPDAGYGDLLALWGIGVMGFLLAFLPARATPAAMWRRLVTGGGIRRWLRRNRVDLAAVLMLVLVGLVVRVYDLEHIPANLGGDEGTQGAAALEFLRSPLGNPFSTGWFSVPTMSFLMYGLWMRVFGATVGGLRTLSAVIGTATVLSTYLLARELWGGRVAWLSSAALAGSHYHIHFSRLGSNQIMDPLVITVVLWLLLLGMRRKERLIFALTGVVIGLGWYGYFGARLVGVVAACYLALQTVFGHRFLARYARQLVILGGGALVVLAPLVIHYAAHPDALTSRPRQVSIFASGWLVREQEIANRGAFGLLFEQFWKSVSAFNYTLDPTFWYRASIPLLDFISGLFFVAGMLWTVTRWRWPASQLLLLWFWLALFLGWVMTENPPSSQRMILATPAVAMLVGLGLDWILEFGERMVGGERVLWEGVGALVLMAVAVLNLGYYFFAYTPTRIYGNPTAEMATRLSRQLVREDDECVVYLHGPPFIYWDHGTFRFMARGIAGVDVPPPGEGDAPEPDLDGGACFVFHRARVHELEDVRTDYPGGTEEYVRSSADGDVLYALYAVGKE